MQFTAEDIDFILGVLRPKVQTQECLVQLLADEDTRDQILDDDSLFQAVLERRDCLRISTHFYFYVLIRTVFRKSNIIDREVADYVAEMLAEFTLSERARFSVPGQTNPLDYFFELLAALQTADDHTSFHIRAHIGNYSLFLSGVFPERIRFRAERRGFPDMNYYESLGKTHFRIARDHRLARRYRMDAIFNTLSEQFRTTRRALNDVADRLFTLSDSNYSFENIWKSAED